VTGIISKCLAILSHTPIGRLGARADLLGELLLAGTQQARPHLVGSGILRRKGRDTMNQGLSAQVLTNKNQHEFKQPGGVKKTRLQNATDL
jgi:hypothetical protein